MAEHKFYIGTRGPYYYDDADPIDDPDGDFAGLNRYGFATQGIGYFGAAPSANDEVIRFQDVSSGIALAVTSVTTTPYAALTSDFFIVVDATVGNITINLPTAVGLEGKEYIIKKIDASANTAIIDPNGVETIDGLATVTLTTQWESLSIVSDGAEWYIQLGASTLDHGTLIGLSDDDHSGYWWLAGRAGGQVGYGGTLTTQNLELHSNVLKDGYIKFGDNAYFDEATDILHLVDDLIIGDGKTIGTTTTPAALTLSTTGSLFITSTRIGTDEGSYNYILGTPIFSAKSGYTYNTVVGYDIANSATGNVTYNSITGASIANTTTGNVYYNSITGYNIANSAAGNIYRNSITGLNIANSATGDVARNSIIGDSIANSATGSVYYNSITGYNIANVATGSIYRNSITGSNIASAATGDVYYNSIMGDNIANVATGNVTYSFSTGQYNLYNTTNAVNLNRVIALPYESLRESSASDLTDAIAIGYRAGYQNAYNSPALFGRQATATANNQVVIGSSFYTGGILLDNNIQVNSQSAATTGQIIQGYAGQLAPLLEVRDSAGNIHNELNIPGATDPTNYFNKAGGDLDSVFKGTTDTNLVHVDAGNNGVAIGQASAPEKLVVAGNFAMPKTTGVGIKVDTTTPTFGWRDIIGDITNAGGANKPTRTTYRGGIDEFLFAAGDESILVFHIPHDYVPGTDIYLHVHWSHISTLVTGGTITFTAESIYAKGHNQAAFSAPVTGTFTGTASTTQYQHIISETQFSASAPAGLQLDTDDLEVDGLILIRLEMTTNNITSSGAVPDPFIHEVDIHYQSTNMATKQKAPNFYT